MDESQRQSDHWFQRNPKKTLVLVVLVFLMVIGFAAEKLLQFNNHRHGIVIDAAMPGHLMLFGPAADRPSNLHAIRAR